MATVESPATTEAPAATRTEALDGPAREAWAQAHAASRAITREVEKRLHENGLPPLAWYEVLHTLKSSEEGGMKQTALAARVQVSPSGLSRLLDRMVARGVVRRCGVDGDRRAIELIVTPEGDELLARIWEVYGKVLATHFAPAVAGHEERIAGVFGDVSGSLQGVCASRIAEAEEACDAAEADCDTAGADALT